MLNRTTLALLATLLFTPTLGLATETTDLDRRVKALEEQQAELYHTLEEKKSAGLATLLDGHLSLSGLIEVEGAYERSRPRTGGSAAASDLTLATAQLGFGARFDEHLGATLTLLYEEADDARIEVDEATIDLGNGPWQARVGRQYLPFGVFRSHFISDPLTLELGETRETALRFGYAQDRLALAGFVFGGDAEQTGRDRQLRDFGASLSLVPVEGLELAASYLSDLADSNAQLLGTEYGRRVGGWSTAAVATLGPIELSGEYLGALKPFAAADFDTAGDDSGDRPRAWNLEAAWQPVESVELAARLEGSDEFAGQPKRQYGLGGSWGFHEHASLSLEYLRGRFDEPFGADVKSRDLVGVQLALAF
jgi:hypothetical protein